MTLLIVDQHRMTADGYCLVTDNAGNTHYEEGYTKIHTLPRGVRVNHDVVSYASIGFVGDPRVFLELYPQIQALLEANEEVSVHELEERVRPVSQGRCQLIFPMTNGAYSISFNGPETPPLGGSHYGETLGFGSAYQKLPAIPEDFRAWYSVFYAAVENGMVPGFQYYVLTHVDPIDYQRQVECKTLKPKNRITRSRNRWCRRVVKPKHQSQ